MTRPILTADEMRAAESAAVAAGTPVEILMERAGTAAAEAILRYAGPMPALVLCGPGNNGGDGWIIARRLAEQGVPVRVEALGEPESAAARAARSGWTGRVEAWGAAAPAPLLVDALFGTGLARPLEAPVTERLCALGRAAQVRVAVDVPSGVATDDGTILSPVPDFDLTIAFAALKPSHLLQPAARHMGRIVVADIGVSARSRLHAVERPKLAPPGPDDHKYRRGYVAVAGGEMPGAAALAAGAAARAGAGYVRIAGDLFAQGLPHAVVQNRGEGSVFEDDRIDVIVAGPGLGRSAAARARLLSLLERRRPMVLDADALFLLKDHELMKRLPRGSILTPHAGEFAALFRERHGDKLCATREAAVASGAVVVLKGADTVIATPEGGAAIASPPHRLATAGTGDVLAGAIAAMAGQGLDPFAAACAGVWLHGRAAELAGPVPIADDLLRHLPVAVAECR